jgi:hypothetical protein
MPRDGSGNYSLPAGNPVVTQTTISSSGWANPTLSDIASALTGSLARDGQSVPTANLPMGNFRHIGCADGQNTNEYATVNQIQTAGLTLLGASAGTINTTKSATTGNHTVNGTMTLNAINGDQGTLTINGVNDTSYGASIALLGNGATTPYKYIRALNGSLSVVNSSYSAQIMSLTDSGNLTAAGDITSSSDERLKTDWSELPIDFIERLSSVKSGTYTRIDTEARQAGVGAQSLQLLLPEAVIESESGILSVAYGQAALVACVELAKEVVRLRALLEPVK